MMAASMASILAPLAAGDRSRAGPLARFAHDESPLPANGRLGRQLRFGARVAEKRSAHVSEHHSRARRLDPLQQFIDNAVEFVPWSFAIAEMRTSAMSRIELFIEQMAACELRTGKSHPSLYRLMRSRAYIAASPTSMNRPSVGVGRTR